MIDQNITQFKFSVRLVTSEDILIMTEMKDKVFKNKEEFNSTMIKKYKLNSLEDVEKDLMEFWGWDLGTHVATVALRMKDNSIDQCTLHLLRETDQKRLDVRTVFGKGYKIRMGKVDLQKFRFRGTMVSDWLGPQDFPHSVQRPATTQPGVWREVEQARVEADGGQELWLRAVVQPWTGLKVKLTVGVYAAKDVPRIQDSSHPRFPLINLVNLNIPLMPDSPENATICLPFVPYLLADADGEMDVPRWPKIVRAVTGMFRSPTPPHSKSNMDNLQEVLKSDWKAIKNSNIFIRSWLWKKPWKNFLQKVSIHLNMGVLVSQWIIVERFCQVD